MPDTYLFPLQDHVGEAPHAEAGRTSDLTPQRQVMAQHTSTDNRDSRLNLLILRSTLLSTSSYYAEEVRRHRANYGRALKATGTDEERTKALNLEDIRHDKEARDLPISSLTDIIVGLEVERKNVMDEMGDCPKRRHRLDFLTRARTRLILLAEAAAKERQLFVDDASSYWGWMRAAIKRGEELQSEQIAKERMTKEEECSDEECALKSFRRLNAENKINLLRTMKFMLLHSYVHNAFLEEAQKQGYVDWYRDLCARDVAKLEQPSAALAECLDAELLEAGRQIDDLRIRIDALTEDEDPDFSHPLWSEKGKVEDRILAATPQTGAGIGVLLRVVYDHSGGRKAEDRVLSEDSEWTIKALWTAIQACERIGAYAPLATPVITHSALTWNDLSPTQRRLLDALDELPEEEADRQTRRIGLLSEATRTHDAIMEVSRPEGMFSTYRAMLARHLSEVDGAMSAGQQPDGFADTISAFQDEAEKALCLPTAPTVDMLEAGAAAAGIDIEQARAIYAAMADAYKKEAA